MRRVTVGFVAFAALVGVATAAESPSTTFCFRNETTGTMEFSVAAFMKGGDKGWDAATISLFPNARGCWIWDRDSGLWETVDVFVRPKESSNVDLPDKERKRWQPCLGAKSANIEYVVRMIGGRLRCGTAANLERN